jgi:rhodanese-related sulfurtransferase
MGLSPVVEMDGGFTAWKNAGFPVATRPAKKSSG